MLKFNSLVAQGRARVREGGGGLTTLSQKRHQEGIGAIFRFATACPRCVCLVTRMHFSSPAACLKVLYRPAFRTYAATPTGAPSMSVSRYQLQRETQLVIQKGDITEWEGDAVVNAGPFTWFHVPVEHAQFKQAHHRLLRSK